MTPDTVVPVSLLGHSSRVADGPIKRGEHESGDRRQCAPQYERPKIEPMRQWNDHVTYQSGHNIPPSISGCFWLRATRLKTCDRVPPRQ